MLIRIVIKSVSLTVLLFLLVASTARADGFGWYATLFDYKKFAAEYDAKLKTKLQRERYGEISYRGRMDDWDILDYLNQNPKQYVTESPYVFSGELLWHEAMVWNTRMVLSKRKDSAIRHLLTGRVFLSSQQIIRCKPEPYQLIHGACRSCILFTNEEARAVFYDMTVALRNRPRFAKQDYETEFHRLRDIFREAALKDRGVYIYGHD